MGEVKIRKLCRQKFVDFLRGLPKSTSLLRQAFDQGTLVLVVADVVVRDMRVEITLDDAASAALDLKLPAGLGVKGSSARAVLFRLAGENLRGRHDRRSHLRERCDDE